ncbi:MAG: rod shape-determining protein MreC [Actinobacteria bacterium 13_1_20CM_3_68_9]|nr:MAG: rod shape-determining protein MreC [Actinobacteria bacterium 13_1_20CM_3_68_9]
MYRKQVRRRRAILVFLVIAALALLSTQVSEREGGPLHSMQRAVASVFGPMEEGATRALKPARDMINWFSETFNARGTNSDLKAENQQLRNELATAQGAQGENQQLRKLLGLDKAGTLAGFTPVTARVIGRSPTIWYSTATIDKGSGSGVKQNDPVVTGDGLAGRITDVTHGTAEVTLITDGRSAVSARVLPSGPDGVAKPEVGNPSNLLLDFIDKSQTIHKGQILVTAGWSNGAISSAFPPGIPIGKVSDTTAGEQQTYQRVNVTPFADIRGLDFVQVATGGPRRPGVPR